MLRIPIAVIYVTVAAAQIATLPPVATQRGSIRDPRSALEATGTAIVRGHVINADGRPLKRVIVVLNQVPSNDTGFDQTNRAATRPVSRTALTDAQGQFQFERVPAGFYRLTARPGPYQAQFLLGGYGQKRPDQPAPPFEVADGQAFTGATIVMPRSGVIEGRVTDDDGVPVARVPVSTVFFAPGSSTPTRSGGAQTDDLGHFRIFGLQPGDYMVVAEVRDGNFGVESDVDPTGFMPTYYPGVPSESEAQHVQVRSGADTSGVDFRLIRGRLFTVSGTVLNSQQQPLSPINVMVMRGAPGRPDSGPINGFSTDPEGHFTMRGLAPGDYKLVIRPRIAPQGAMVMNGRQLPDMAEFATVDLHVDSDITDFVITTRPALSIAGRVVFADGVPTATPGSPDPLRNIRISATGAPGSTMFSPTATAQVASDLTFTLRGLSSAAMVHAGGLPQNFVLKQVLVGGEDITDKPHDFVDRDSGDLQVVLTSRVAGVEGSVLDDSGKPAVDSLVVLLPEPEQGRPAVLYRTSSVDPHGRFKLPGLRSGRFVILAIPRERLPRSNDTDALDALAKDAQAITLGDGEFKVIDLKVSGGR
jgi:hypothetical protein